MSRPPVAFWSTLALALLGGCQAKEAAPLADAPPTWTDPSPHRTGFVPVNGNPLNYLDWGGSGTPLILIHGNGQNPHVFDDLAPALGGQFRIVAYARRGQGHSGKSGPFDTVTLTEDLRTLMDSLGIARAHMAGWSMGGNEITMMAGKYPERVGRLVYLDAAYDWSDPAFAAAFKELPIDLAPKTETLASLDRYRAWHLAVFFPGVSDPTRLEGYVRDLIDLQADGTVRPVAPDSIAQALTATVLTDQRDYRTVKAPALAIYSATFLDTVNGDSAQRARMLAWEEKHIGPFRKKSIERVKRELRSPEVVTVPGTHVDFVFTARDQVVEAIRRFLAP